MAVPDVLRLKEFRLLVSANLFLSFAGRALVVVTGFYLYSLTGNVLALGLLGLVEAIPAICLSLLGGHVADRRDRRSILLIGQTVLVLTGAGFIVTSLFPSIYGIAMVYIAAFCAGTAKGFTEPAARSFEQQVIPEEYAVQGTAVLGSTLQALSIAGPAIGGVIFALWGPTVTFSVVTLSYILSVVCLALIPPKPVIPHETHSEPLLKSIREGIRYVFNEQLLWGSMSLDLFAVLFGGAVALLPVFASDVLHVGAWGLGLLNAAPAAGALLISLYSSTLKEVRHAGVKLLVAVAGFGVSMIVFGFSTNFALSLVALFFSGVFDGFSMVIRHAITRLSAPEHMRGRINSVMMIFIGTSNEIGAFESGVAASIFGTMGAVWGGGLLTLATVAITATFAPRLRNYEIGVQSAERREELVTA
jgi:MFS family permease